ncbi:hypothetical protein [Paenibacillus cymbidii]|uniref:hypothetical protein n=1 Tax=Paenibacillus cymbidii TaxID=1639034 RepID=UPI0010803080|nr:hypothetical protein [Paenibacillus cymbidii]
MNVRIRDAVEADIGDIIKLRRQIDDYHAILRPEQFISADLYNEQTVTSYYEADVDSNTLLIRNKTHEGD